MRSQEESAHIFSFEFFPPKTPEGVEKLRATRRQLAQLKPAFFSVTFGAGGSTRDRTHATIARILKETRLTPAAHLTCVDASRGEVDDVVAQYHDVGVRHIVALRGDPSTGAPRLDFAPIHLYIAPP